MGKTHPDTLESCYDFARGLFKANKIAEAKEFAQRAVDGARKMLGPEHPSTQKYRKVGRGCRREAVNWCFKSVD